MLFALQVSLKVFVLFTFSMFLPKMHNNQTFLYPRTVCMCVQYLRILFSAFGGDDFYVDFNINLKTPSTIILASIASGMPFEQLELINIKVHHTIIFRIYGLRILMRIL